MVHSFSLLHELSWNVKPEHTKLSDIVEEVMKCDHGGENHKKGVFLGSNLCAKWLEEITCGAGSYGDVSIVHFSITRVRVCRRKTWGWDSLGLPLMTVVVAVVKLVMGWDSPEDIFFSSHWIIKGNSITLHLFLSGPHDL